MPPASPRQRPPTVLALDEIDEGVHQLQFEVEAERLGLEAGEFEFTAPVRVRLRVGRTMSMFTVDGHLRTGIAGECCRCLQPASAPLEADIRFLLQRKEASGDEIEALEESDDVDLVDPGTREVDLVERLHDAVVLELPLRLYCKTDCKGLCPRCGHDLNAGDCGCVDEVTDPRWEALAGLRKQAPLPGPGDRPGQ